MMRKIKFRGKCGGSWVYGDLSHDENGDSIIGNTYRDSLHVDNKTVCQYTGVRDKDGTEIYEGSIVEAWDRGVKAIKEVRWRQEGCPQYILYPAYSNNQWYIFGTKSKDGKYYDTGVKVIGDIYTNPELRERE